MADEDKLEPNPDLAPANQNDPAAAERPSLEPLVVELRDKYLRAVAETENIRKRAERDVAEARAYGTRSVEMISGDHLHGDACAAATRHGQQRLIARRIADGEHAKQ